ncbi:MAG: L,D-transpeptidase family protein [Chitinophagaceae bacterium]|nr:L,D-transpeptidase family protein [Chitinophagaceae bacterium]
MTFQNLTRALFCLFGSLWFSAGSAQITPGQLQQYIQDPDSLNRLNLKMPVQVRNFYQSNGYRFFWSFDSNKNGMADFLHELEKGKYLGLDEKEYGYTEWQNRLKDLPVTAGPKNPLETELRLTDAALHFYRDLAYGNTGNPVSYNGLNHLMNCIDIPAMLAESLNTHTLDQLISRLLAPLPETGIISNRIRWYQSRLTDTAFKENRLLNTKANDSNRTFVNRLYQLGIIDSIPKDSPDSLTKKMIRAAQRSFDLPEDGIFRKNLLNELNVPISSRLRQLEYAINLYRWLNCILRSRSVIVVNIPAAKLTVYRNSYPVLGMNVIVGKRTTPTPTLASTVREVVLYPYWHVPRSIATKEMLPILKRNPGYINSGNFQVMDRSGRVVNPYSVDWNSLTKDNFPYLIRQSTGCDNSLGLLKLDFENPFGVYLHDTPGKSLFKKNKRFFSHGCMRMQDPMALGHLVLRNNPGAIDTLEQRGCLRNPSPIVIPADDPMPVIVWYNLVGINDKGSIIFYEDVYGKLSGKRK